MFVFHCHYDNVLCFFKCKLDIRRLDTVNDDSTSLCTRYIGLEPTRLAAAATFCSIATLAAH